MASLPGNGIVPTRALLAYSNQLRVVFFVSIPFATLCPSFGIVFTFTQISIISFEDPMRAFVPGFFQGCLALSTGLLWSSVSRSAAAGSDCVESLQPRQARNQQWHARSLRKWFIAIKATEIASLILYAKFVYRAISYFEFQERSGYILLGCLIALLLLLGWWCILVFVGLGDVDTKLFEPLDEGLKEWGVYWCTTRSDEYEG